MFLNYAESRFRGQHFLLKVCEYINYHVPCQCTEILHSVLDGYQEHDPQRRWVFYLQGLKMIQITFSAFVNSKKKHF